ncbi:MAG: class I SAM-dependent methyltransferase [Parachlamydiales bacterium]
MFTTKTEIINYLIEKYGYEDYLEIGVQNSEGEYKKINAKYKVGVDPDPKAKADYVTTSDEFFKSNKHIFDIILIDGLHEWETVLRDIENSLRVLGENGTIVMHDCKPVSKIMQKVPRESKQWTGDVWKAFVQTRIDHIDLDMFVVNCDFGVGIIRRASDLKEFNIGSKKLNYENFEKNLNLWTDLTEPDQLIEKLCLL